MTEWKKKPLQDLAFCICSVRENSGKSKGILKRNVCGNHAYCIRNILFGSFRPRLRSFFTVLFLSVIFASTVLMTLLTQCYDCKYDLKMVRSQCVLGLITSRCSGKEPALLPRRFFSGRNVDQTIESDRHRA